jgi:hypothetical protein
MSFATISAKKGVLKALSTGYTVMETAFQAEKILDNNGLFFYYSYSLPNAGSHV